MDGKYLGFFQVLSASLTVSKIKDLWIWVYHAFMWFICHVKPVGPLPNHYHHHHHHAILSQWATCQTTTTTTTTIIIILITKLKFYHKGALLSIWFLPSSLPNRSRPRRSQNIPGGISHTSQQQHALKYVNFQSALCIESVCDSV